MEMAPDGLQQRYLSIRQVLGSILGRDNGNCQDSTLNQATALFFDIISVHQQPYHPKS
jgi:hypothetical protein